MIRGVSVSQTEVQCAHGAGERHQLPLLALDLVALVAEHLSLLPSLAVVLDVLRHGVVRDAAPAHWDRLTAQGTHGDLNVFLVQARTVVLVVLKVVFTEYQRTGVTFHWKKVKLTARLLAAMFT